MTTKEPANLMQFLLRQKRIDPNQQDEKGHTPLSWAARTRRRSGDWNVSCAALAGWAAQCITAEIGRTRIFPECETGLRWDWGKCLYCRRTLIRVRCLQVLIWGLIVLESNFLQLWLLSLLAHTCWFCFGRLTQTNERIFGTRLRSEHGTDVR